MNLTKILVIAAVLLTFRVHQLEHALDTSAAVSETRRDQVTDAREYISRLTSRKPGVRR